MIKKGSPIEIIRVENGWLVRPGYMHEKTLVGDYEVCVFSHLQYDQQGTQSELTLVGFLGRHFGPEP